MRYLIFIITICLFSSCDDWLDVKPENSVTYSNFFQDETDLEAIAVEIHAHLSAYIIGDGEAQLWTGLMADEWSDTYTTIRGWKPSAIMGSMSPWRAYYDIIFLSNVLLENSSRAADKVREERMNFWNGQAYFAKAVSYFLLSRHFGEAVITKNSVSLEAYGKSSAMEVIDEAIRNARIALNLLPNYEDMKNVAGNTITSKQYGNRGSVVAFLAHMYAWKGSLIDLFHYEGNREECYQTAIQYADMLINQETGIYALQNTPEDLCVAISKVGGPNPESIYEVELNADAWLYPLCNVPGRMFVGWPIDKNKKIEETQYSSFRIFRETVNKVFDPNEKRKQAYFYETVESVSVPVVKNGQIIGERDSVVLNPMDSTYAYVIKWREGLYKVDNSISATEIFICLKANQILWRLADIYLLRAECHVKLGHDDLAIADLNKIRDRAGAALYPAATDTQGLQFAVFRERERELFGEGHRFYDVVRNGMSYIKTYLGEPFQQMSDNDILNGSIFLPIPDGAFTQNDLMRQNNYWRQFEY